MSVLYIVLPAALVIVGAAIAAYAWATRSGQFDDLSTPAVRMLFEAPAVRPDDERDAANAQRGADRD